jgi:hypothetical protein
MSEPERCKFGSRWYRRIEPTQAQAGDLIRIYERGYRWRRVKAITKRRRIRTLAFKYNGALVYREKSVNPADVVSAWTKRKQ